jgi:hypothetical protein
VLKVRVCDDLEEGQRLWQHNRANACLFDLWPVRACFQERFNHRPCFLVAERNWKIEGVLALSWIEEEAYFGNFPGETWRGKTWLEQNKIMASDQRVFNELLDHIPGPANIRYLTRNSMLMGKHVLVVDEIGYLFHPGRYAYSFQVYMQQFSGKSRKKLGRELANLQAIGLSYRYDDLQDLEYIFRLNQETFGEWSYFNDSRFLKSFESLILWLKERGMARVTTVILGGKVAAVDVGALWGSSYTLLAGGTHSDFPGVAKLINFHHLEWACRQRIEEVDFLCGDFGWKERFHLTPRPLYAIRIPSEQWVQDVAHARSSAVCG